MIPDQIRREKKKEKDLFILANYLFNGTLSRFCQVLRDQRGPYPSEEGNPPSRWISENHSKCDLIPHHIMYTLFVRLARRLRITS